MSPLNPDTDGDSRMTANPADTLLSPPESQHTLQPQTDLDMPNPASVPNGNGKRPITDDYTWVKEQDEPGYAWLNKKAVAEAERAGGELVGRESVIKGHYGDPFEMAEKERAVMRSLREQ